MSIETIKQALEAAYLAGFNASGEGYNGEYPFGDKMQAPSENRVWKKGRDNYVSQAIAEAEKQELVAWMYPDALCDRNCLYLCTNGFTQFPECASSQPQRQWVGLDWNQMPEIYMNDKAFEHGAQWAETFLKGKNT